MIDTILDFHEFLDVSRVFSFASVVSIVAIMIVILWMFGDCLTPFGWMSCGLST